MATTSTADGHRSISAISSRNARSVTANSLVAEVGENTTTTNSNRPAAAAKELRWL